MEEFWILIFVLFLATNSLDKAESVQLEELEELPLQTFDELFVDEWWDKSEADVKTPPPTNFGQNVHHQIDRQNTQIGQIEPNSIDQLGQIKPNSTDQYPPLTDTQLGQIEPNSTDQNPHLTESDHSVQIEPNSTDQNPPLTESDHSDNAKNSENQNQIIKEITSNENNAENQRKRKAVDKFHAMKDEFKQKGKYSKKEWTQIEEKIGKYLKVNRSKIYKWKKELGLSRKRHNYGKEKEERNHLVEKFDQKKAELKRDGFKNSYKNELDKTVAKELCLSFMTIYRWKNEIGQTAANNYTQNKQKEFLIKSYYEIKDKNPKNSDADIAKMLRIGRVTLYKWKRQFNRQHPNSVDGHSMEENGAANVQEI